MNPFGKSLSPSPLSEWEEDCWVCVAKNKEKLEEAYHNNVNTVLLGVEGSGKTTLLNMFFTEAFCAESARNRKLIVTADLSDAVEGKKLCNYLLRKLQQAARRYLAEADYAALLATVEEIQSQKGSDQEQFVSACKYLYGRHYTILLVMDRFEYFVSAPSIKQEQHDVLRGLLDKNIMRCVVATNYDFEQTSLPPDIQGSMYLQKFQNKITLAGFSLENAKEFVAQRINPADPVQFNDKRIDFLHRLTGGIPLLFGMAAYSMYDILEKYGSVTVGQVTTALLDRTRTYISNWCKFFTTEYEEALRQIVAEGLPEGVLKRFFVSKTKEKEDAAVTRLTERGFLVEDGLEEGYYTFNSLLLQSIAAKGSLPVQQSRQPEAVRLEKKYNVFIAYKRTFVGEQTRDSEIAKELYYAFERAGFVPFLDVMEMPYGIGGSDFDKTITAALDMVSSLVFVCTRGDFLDTPWVHREWSGYHKEMLCKRKPEGSIYGVLENTTDDDLPFDLRHVELFPFDPESVDRLVLFIKNQWLRDRK